MSTKKRDGQVITLGSGDLMIKEFLDEMPAYTDFNPETDLLGRIKGGATLEYSGEWYTATDDTGKVSKTIITEEEATLTSGIITWNGNTLAKLCATGRVTDDAEQGIRIVKIGGIANNDGKSYALCFHHTDKIDGDVWIVIRAVNQGGFSHLHSTMFLLILTSTGTIHSLLIIFTFHYVSTYTPQPVSSRHSCA